MLVLEPPLLRGECFAGDVGMRHGLVLGDECIDLLGGGRQAEQVEGEPPDERPRRGGRRGLEAGHVESVEDECIDRRAHPLPQPHLRDWRQMERLEGPMLPGGGEDRLLITQHGTVAARCPGGPIPDPLLERRDLLVGEPASGGHLQVVISDRIDEQTCVGLAGHDGGPAEAPGECCRAGGEREPRFLLHRPVTLLATSDEYRPHAALEELELTGGEGFVRRRPAPARRLDPGRHCRHDSHAKAADEGQRSMTAGEHASAFLAFTAPAARPPGSVLTAEPSGTLPSSECNAPPRLRSMPGRRFFSAFSPSFPSSSRATQQ